MPELPEVETIRLGLKEILPGKVFKDVIIYWPKSLNYSKEYIIKNLYKTKILGLKRRGKLLIIDLDNQYFLLIHLKMTGQIIYKDKNFRFGAGHPNDSFISKMPDKSTRVEIIFDDGSKLYFNYQRKFGWIKLLNIEEYKKFNFLNSLGLEPLESSFSFEVFKKRLNLRIKSSIKSVLLDQKIIAGLGNIYVDESLWMAKIHPKTIVKDIPLSKLKILHQSIISVLRFSIDQGGASDRNYLNIKGEKGSFTKFAQVYKRKGLLCSRCGHQIIKIKVAGRGSHLCPNCQKLKTNR